MSQISNYAKFGIPKNYANADMDNLHIDKSKINFCKSWVDKHISGDISKGLYAFGPEGAGKTFFSCSLVMRSILKGTYAFRITSQRLGEEYFKDFSIPEYTGKFGLLVIENLGVETQNIRKNMGSIIRYIASSRVENSQAIVLTSNYTPKDLSTAYMSSGLDEFITSNFFKVSLGNNNMSLDQKEVELKKIKGA